MNAVLLSLKPNFAERILEGHKTAEVRRRFPNLPPTTRVFIYASSPSRAVLGSFILDAVHVGAPSTLWDQFGARLDINREYFDRYLEGTSSGSVLEVGTAVRWEQPIPLAQLRSAVGIEPPQSYRYLNLEQAAHLRDGAR